MEHVKVDFARDVEDCCKVMMVNDLVDSLNI
jgi:hypothetical protein